MFEGLRAHQAATPRTPVLGFAIRGRRSLYTMGSKFRSTSVRMTWPDICRSSEYLGRWVALDNVLFAQGVSQPAEADVVDDDEDLAALIARIRAADRTACAILFVEHEPEMPVSVRRRSPLPPRNAHR
ncbi:MAG TPA: hypothetical protein VLS89_16520 [Candidatus Nanopelagicales bacterium]|nr:hypothetical protein [Candidatus Nanopelagicales bacterium]